jgi:hypothetical protein
MACVSWQLCAAIAVTIEEAEQARAGSRQCVWCGLAAVMVTCCTGRQAVGVGSMGLRADRGVAAALDCCELTRQTLNIYTIHTQHARQTLNINTIHTQHARKHPPNPITLRTYVQQHHTANTMDASAYPDAWTEVSLYVCVCVCSCGHGRTAPEQHCP